MPDIFDAIKTDHDRHRDLLDKIASTSGDSQDRRDAWDDFYREVKSHAAAEEETFYSRMIEKTWGQDMARHSVHEHQELDDLLEELNQMDMAEGAWLQKFKTLRHDYEHHIDEEEEDLFKRAREVLSKDAIQAAGPEFAKRKEEERGLIAEKRAEKLEE